MIRGYLFGPSKWLQSPILLQVAQQNAFQALIMKSTNLSTSQPLRVAPSTSPSPSVTPGS